MTEHRIGLAKRLPVPEHQPGEPVARGEEPQQPRSETCDERGHSPGAARIERDRKRAIARVQDHLARRQPSQRDSNVDEQGGKREAPGDGRERHLSREFSQEHGRYPVSPNHSQSV